MLVDRLEAVINGGRRWFNHVVIDEREALDVLDLMRTAVPEEIKQARRVNQEREKILAQAQTEASRVVTQAQERAERLLAQENIRVVAEERSREIVEQARREADDIRQGADDYALQMLERLNDQLQRIEGNVRNAVNVMTAQPRVSEEPAREEQV